VAGLSTCEELFLRGKRRGGEDPVAVVEIP